MVWHTFHAGPILSTTGQPGSRADLWCRSTSTIDNEVGTAGTVSPVYLSLRWNVMTPARDLANWSAELARFPGTLKRASRRPVPGCGIHVLDLVPRSPVPDLLLVGAGHAHLYVVKRAGELAAAGYRVQLLAPRYFDYSGVASATAAGVLDSDAGRIDVRALVGVSGVEFHEGTLESLDPEARIAITSDRAQLSYDVLSVSIGSVVEPASMHVHPTVLRVKPLSGLADLDVRLRNSTRTSAATVTVVGGGATGLEVAAHLAVRRDVALVRLVECGPVVGADLPAGARRRTGRLLAARGVDVRTGCVVRGVGERQLVCDDGSEISHDVALLATGLSAPPRCSPSSDWATRTGCRCEQRSSTWTGTRSMRWATARASFRARCRASACTACGKDRCCNGAFWHGFGESVFRCISPSVARCPSSISVTVSGSLSGDAGGGTAPGRCASSGSSIDVG